MTDAEWLELLEAALGHRWHIWHKPGETWNALPKDPPFGDPIRADTPRELVDKLNEQGQS